MEDVERGRFQYLETRNLNQDPLENTFDVIHLHCGSNNPTVGQFRDALKTSINGLAFRYLQNNVRMIRLRFWTIYIHS